MAGKNLSLYREQIVLLKKQREQLDEDIAQVLAEGLHDGFNVIELLAPHSAANQPDFDL